MIKRKAGKMGVGDGAALRLHGSTLMPDDDEAHGKRTLVCVCQPDVFLREGRCMCGYDTTLPAELRKIHSQASPKPRQPSPPSALHRPAPRPVHRAPRLRAAPLASAQEAGRLMGWDIGGLLQEPEEPLRNQRLCAQSGHTGMHVLL